VPASRRRRESAQDDEISRYRKAADLAIEQLDWVVNYLHQIHKSQIANALRKNRTTIVKRYRGS
jgi:hypothetical protein